MIKQDYLLRMIQQIIAMLLQALISKRKIAENDWAQYDNLSTQLLGATTDDLSRMDAGAIIARYQDNPDKWELCELAATLLLKLSDDADDTQVATKARLRQNGTSLLEYVQANGPTFSLQRSQLLQLLKSGQQ